MPRNAAPGRPSALREMLATGGFPRLAEVLRTRTSHPPPDTFEAGLEWLFDGMEAVLEARRG